MQWLVRSQRRKKSKLERFACGLDKFSERKISCREITGGCALCIFFASNCMHLVSMLIFLLHKPYVLRQPMQWRWFVKRRASSEKNSKQIFTQITLNIWARKMDANRERNRHLISYWIEKQASANIIEHKNYKSSFELRHANYLLSNLL